MKNGITSIEIEEIENYLSYIRPSEEIRDQLDIGYRIEKQSVIILKLDLDRSKRKLKTKAAVTFVKKERSLKVYWQRRFKMAFYKPQPILINLLDFIQLIEKDEYGCFWDSFTKPISFSYFLMFRFDLNFCRIT
jgi:hypothetical protein